MYLKKRQNGFDKITMNFYQRALELKEYGLNPEDCGAGVTATLGSGGKVLLLRADMDALPMPEESGEPFACPTGETAHTCGHDFHAAMLLSAAKMHPSFCARS